MVAAAHFSNLGYLCFQQVSDNQKDCFPATRLIIRQFLQQI